MPNGDDLPQEVKERAEAIKDENPDLSESEAIAIARDQLNLADDDECPDGHARVGDECVPIPEGIDSVDAPPSILSTSQHLTLKSLDTEPIERVDEGDTVRYKSLKLLSPGVWSDAGSQTATYYPPEGIASLEAHYDESEHDGPPVNIMHDLDMDTFEAHEASVAGYVDPETLDTDDEGNLFGDVVFDTSKGAGQFADENLQSTLENEGTVGFGGPSVEIPAEGLQQSHDESRDMPRVDGGRLSGVAMVMDPASKSVNFAREAARRPVAMSASGESGKVLTRESGGMRDKFLSGAAETLKTLADPGEVREILDMFGLDTDELDDEEVMDMAEDLHADLMDELEGGDEEGEGVEAEDDEDEEEEEEEDAEMQEDDDLEMVMERVQNLATRLEDLEDQVGSAMSADDVSAELEAAKGAELAAADTVEEVKRTLEEMGETVEAIANEPDDSKTLADVSGSEFEPTYDNPAASESGW